MGKVEFISYNGKYPTLCYGVLVIKVDDKEYSLSGCLHSGGSVTSDSDWNFDVSTGPWEINESSLPVELQKHYEEIKKVVNANVEYGCCGGCI
jgi:hypothetical protein